MAASRRRQILVVEDDAELARRVGTLLETQGYSVERARDGSEALVKFREKRPDLVILDAVMPKLSGFHVARLLKFDPQFKDVPILMITILARPEDKERGEHVGVDLYLTKPFSDEGLLEHIRKLLPAEG